MEPLNLIQPRTEFISQDVDGRYILSAAGFRFVRDLFALVALKAPSASPSLTGAQTDTLTVTAAAPVTASGQVGFGATVSTTVGAAGSASAPPANPTGYLTINVAGTDRKVPYYAT